VESQEERCHWCYKGGLGGGGGEWGPSGRSIILYLHDWLAEGCKVWKYAIKFIHHSQTFNKIREYGRPPVLCLSKLMSFFLPIRFAAALCPLRISREIGV